jgi:hypothetical protein
MAVIISSGPGVGVRIAVGGDFGVQVKVRAKVGSDNWPGAQLEIRSPASTTPTSRELLEMFLYTLSIRTLI